MSETNTEYIKWQSWNWVIFHIKLYKKLIAMKWLTVNKSPVIVRNTWRRHSSTFSNFPQSQKFPQVIQSGQKFSVSRFRALHYFSLATLQPITATATVQFRSNLQRKKSWSDQPLTDWHPQLTCRREHSVLRIPQSGAWEGRYWKIFKTNQRK